MPVCMVLVELAITCIHDCMVVTVTKIYGKMNFNRWGPCNYSQSSRKRRITCIGTHVFSLGRMIFARQEFRVRMFF